MRMDLLCMDYSSNLWTSCRGTVLAGRGTTGTGGGSHQVAK